jgi:biopolymer transport protein ExbB
MIIAFQEMARQTKVNPADLAGGIYTAMITTAAGLVVGIIAYISYNYLVNKVDKVIFQLEARTTEFLDLLHHNN